MHPAIFLDRDGVIIENRSSYVRSWEDVAIFGQALTALAQIESSPYKIVVVTNQSAVGRGIIPLEMAWEINNRLIKIIQQTGGRIDGVYLCPHVPEDGCNCRKPEPGLLLRAADKLSLDLSRSILVGDALSDILAGKAAGIKHLALVRTGRGAKQSILAEVNQLQPLLIYDTLADAVSELLS